LCICWLLFVIILEKIDFLLNSFIFIDMYYTLKNPFEPQRNRNLIFMSLSMFAIFFIIAYYAINFNVNDFDKFSFYYKISMQRLLIGNYVNIFIRTIVFIYDIFCFIKVMIRLCRPSMNSDLKIMIMKRHIIYMFIFYFQSLPLYIFGSYELSDPFELFNSEFPQTIFNFIKIFENNLSSYYRMRNLLSIF